MKVLSYKNGKLPPILPHIFIITTITLAAIAVAIVLGQKNHHAITQLATEQFNRQQLILARSAAKGIESFIADIDDDMRALSDFPVVQKMEPGILERMGVLYKGIPPKTSSRRLDKEGILRFIYPNEGWRKDLVGRDYSGDAFFQKAKKIKKTVISELFTNEMGDRRIRVVRPVFVEDEKGEREFNGVIIGSVDPETLSRLHILPIVSGETGYAWLLNEEGIFVAHYEEKFVGQNAFKARAEKNPDLSYEAINQIQQKMMAGKEGTGRYISGWHRGHKGKIEKLIAYTPVHIFDKVWSVTVCAPASEVEQITSEAHRNHLYILGFIILILAAAGVFFFITFYRWAQSLQQEIEIRKQAEERIIHLNAVLRAIRNVNQLIIKEKAREKLLQGACDNLIETRGYDSAWIALTKDGGFVTAAQAGVGKDFLKAIDKLKSGNLTQCIRQAVEQPGIVVVTDPAVECGDCPLAGTYAGKARAIARLEHEGSVYGFLTVTVPVEMATDEEEQSLFGEVAEDIAFALQTIEAEAERKRMEEALQQSEEKYRTLIESTLDLIFTIDRKGKYTYINPMFERVTGYSSLDLMGHPFTYIVAPEHVELTTDRFKRGIRGKAVPPYEADLIHKDGKRIPVEFLVTTLYDTDGQPMGRFGIGRDITERKLLEGQLRHAQKMEAVGTLAGGISHDFNNALQIISGYIQLLLMRKGKDDPDRNYLDEIDRSIQRAAELVRQLLIFSRKVESKLGPVGLNQEVAQVHKLLEKTIPRMISLETHLVDDLKTINADPIQLEQVIMNLAVNARDAMPDGGRIIVETENIVLDEEYSRTHLGATSGEYVLLIVSDTGSGMDSETLEHIFEPFYTTKEAGKGTGLGLASVYGIVKSHGGYIMCYSEPDRGTTFKIYFPVLEVEGAEQVQEHKEVEEVRGGSETILLVDDEKTILDIGSNILGRYGYTTITAESGESAIDVYGKERNRIDLVILDVGMPGMGGHKCLQELLRIDPKIKIIMTSGYSPNGKVKETLAAGAAGFIGKPYQLDDMLRKVREVLD